LLADRFNPHHPYDPYVDPMYPDATNSVDCFTQSCTEEEQLHHCLLADLSGWNQHDPHVAQYLVGA
jgi:hypothetical protein